MLLFAKFREALSLVVFAAWTTMGSTAFVESQQTSGEIAFASIAMVTIFNFGLCITEYILFSMIIRDLRKVVARTAATKVCVAADALTFEIIDRYRLIRSFNSGRVRFPRRLKERSAILQLWVEY